jgi:DNA-binding NarL/FixJ family response regulator
VAWGFRDADETGYLPVIPRRAGPLAGCVIVGVLYPASARVARIPRGRVRSTRDNPAGLTERQTDVVRLLAEGLTNAEIAARLVLSVRTVDTHVAAILNKLDAKTRRDAATRARGLGLLPA